MGPARSDATGQRSLSRATLAALVLACGACSSTYEHRDWSTYDGPGARYFQQEEVPFPHEDDPLEPVNRVFAWFDLEITRYVFSPVAMLYRGIVVRPVREHLANAGENILFPTRFCGNLLQAKWKDTGTETLRFVVNSTIGVLGLFDPAARMGLMPSDEDFGQVFARWGWTNSTYVFWPIFGPSTVRDTLGDVPDYYTNPLRLYPWADFARRANEQSDLIPTALRFTDTRWDAYELARTLYTLNRELETEDFIWTSDESPATQTLESIFLTFEDPQFPERARTDRVRLSTTGERLPYTLWLQRDPAPLVYVVPGLGGHRLSNSAIALAEIVHDEGNSVITVSNPTNWEFIEKGSTADVSGYAPHDARDLWRALTEIDAEVERRYPGHFTSRRLVGISMGAFQALLIAAEERDAQARHLLPFDVYVALDPPVNLEHAMLQLDRFYNAPLVFPEAERSKRIDDIFGKVLVLSQGELDPGMELPFTQLEAEFLIGLSFRMDLQYAILQTQDRHDLGVLRTNRSRLRRAPAFREASEYGFMEYMYAFVLRSLAEQAETGFTYDEESAQRMFASCDLRAVEAELAANEHVRVFANENDFLLRAEDRDWLRAVLGSRVRFFPAGGHLGNLHKKTIQEVIHGIVEKADKADGQP